MSELSGRAPPPRRPQSPLWLEAAESVVTGAVMFSALATVALVALGIYSLVRSVTGGWRWWSSPAAFAGAAAAAAVCRALWWGLQKTERVGVAYETPSAWDEYRRRVWCFQAVLIGGLLLIATLASGPPAVAAALVIVFPLWMLACFGAGFRLQFFACPRCHRPFFFRWDFRNPFALSCMRCGLPKWDEPDQPGERENETGENGD